MAQSQIQVSSQEVDGGLIATVVIANPTRLNALNSGLMAEFVAAVSALGRDDRLRALIVTGASDRAFVGGADIKEMAVLGGPEAARAFIGRVHACCEAVRAVPVPTIARLNGYTFGAGLELAASCDLRVAADTAVFGMPEVKLGVPSVVEAALLPMLVGWGRARRLLLLGESIDAPTALAWGLVERVAPTSELDEAVQAWIAQLLTCAPGAVRLQKALIRAWEDLPLRDAIAAGVDSFARAFESEEPTAAMQAFLAEQARRKRER